MSITLIDPEKHIHLETVDSTNTYLKSAEIPPGTWVTARSQTRGRGRGKNSWIDFGAEHLFLSAKISITTDHDIAPLPLLVGCAVLKACLPYAPVTLKWPNDIFRGDRKIAGVLVEAERTTVHTIIIGVGINISGESAPAELSQAGFLCDEPQKISGDALAKSIIDAINESIPQLTHRQEWILLEQHSYLSGKRIRAQYCGKPVEGTFAGYSPRGELILASGTTQLLISDAAYDVEAV